MNKFSIGETVIIESSTYPEFNGQEAVVTSIRTRVQATSICPHWDMREAFFYDVGIEIPSQHGFEPCPFTRESSLRKKYPPSTQSFKEIMNDLKTFSIS